MLIYNHVRDMIDANERVSAEMVSPCITPRSVLRLIFTPDRDTEINLYSRGKQIINLETRHLITVDIHYPMNLMLARYETFRLEVINLTGSPLETCICFVWQEYFK